MYHRLQGKPSRRRLITGDGSLIAFPQPFLVISIRRHCIVAYCRGKDGERLGRGEPGRVRGGCDGKARKSGGRVDDLISTAVFFAAVDGVPDSDGCRRAIAPSNFFAVCVMNIVIGIVYRAGRLHNSGVCLDRRVSRIEKERGSAELAEV